MLKTLLMKFLKNEIAKEKQVAVNEAVKKAIAERRENEANFRRVVHESYKGKPIIILTNEWNNPIIGEVIDLEYGNGNNPWYVCQDYISGEVCCCLSEPKAFSMQKLQILGKLNPDEICAMYFEGVSYHSTFRKLQSYGKENPNKFTGYEDWMENLTKNGFFERFGDFLQKKESEWNVIWKEKLAEFPTDPANFS